MERADGERLARVTYLPGAQPPSGRSVPEQPAAVAPPRPTFAAIYDDEPTAGQVDLADDRPVADSADDAVDRDAERAHAEKVSMHALTRRGQSRRELERTLRARDISDETVLYEADRLERVGLIDDVALAQNLVGVLQERKGLGRSAIAAELARRMLAPAAIEYALDLVDTGDELARAREIAVKRAGQLGSYDRETAQRRLSAYLARRGYSGSTVRAAVDHALAGRRSVGGVRFR